MSAFEWQELQAWRWLKRPGIKRTHQWPRPAFALFGQSELMWRVCPFTADQPAWGPYCQKGLGFAWRMRIPYRIRKVTMFCYGRKGKAGSKQFGLPSGMCPAPLALLDGPSDHRKRSTDSFWLLKARSGPLGDRMKCPLLVGCFCGRFGAPPLFGPGCQWPGVVPHWQQLDGEACWPSRQFDRIRAEQVDEVFAGQSPHQAPFFLGKSDLGATAAI